MRLRPEDFWALSPGEWRALASAAADAALSRPELDALFALYPDETP